jgi:hypothetical protein
MVHAGDDVVSQFRKYLRGQASLLADHDRQAPA